MSEIVGSGLAFERVSLERLYWDVKHLLACEHTVALKDSGREGLA